jgi:phosphoribosylglycinamide formyltransferase-1
VSHAALPVAVLISGTGSNLKALIDARDAGRLDIDLCMVVSNRPEAPGLQHARNGRVPFTIINAETAGGADRQDAEIAACLDRCGAELVVLAGYMRILGAGIVERFAGRMINLHPSLLPSYPGLDTYSRVLATADTEHGSSIHFVTAELDGGPVISQVRIPILEGDDPHSLAARLGPNEHRLLLATVELFTRHRVKMGSEGVLMDGIRLQRPLLLNDDDSLEIPE